METNPTQAGCSDGETIVASTREPGRFAAIFDRHYNEILSYLARRVDWTLAEELAEETFVRAFAGRGGYDAAYRDARPWLYGIGIATNLLRKHARSEERRRRAYAPALERDEYAGGLEGAAERVDAATRAQSVAVELSRMEAAERDTLLLFALTDLGYDGVAAATACAGRAAGRNCAD